MLPETWQDVRRVLAIHLSSSEDMLLNSAPRMLRQLLPSSTITLMTSPTASRLQLPWIDDLLVYEGVGFTSLNAERELALIEELRERAFDAAVIFTNPGESPYPLAYICYLAGIRKRLGQSQEFGGSVLSDWVKPTGSE